MLFSVPEVHWTEYQYVVMESEMTVKVCAELTGTLNSVIEVDLVTEDFSAVGKNHMHDGILCINTSVS